MKVQLIFHVVIKKITENVVSDLVLILVISADYLPSR